MQESIAPGVSPALAVCEAYAVYREPVVVVRLVARELAPVDAGGDSSVNLRPSSELRVERLSRS